MAYTRAWSETRPDGAVVMADQIDDELQYTRVDFRERIAGAWGMNAAQFAADPIVPISFTVSTSLTSPLLILEAVATPFARFSRATVQKAVIGTSNAGAIYTGSSDDALTLRSDIGRINFCSSSTTLEGYIVAGAFNFPKQFGPASTGAGILTGSNIDFNWNDGNQLYYPNQAGNYTVTLSNGQDGKTYKGYIIQDAIGGRTITFTTTVRWLNGTPTWSTIALKINQFTITYIGATAVGMWAAEP